MRHLVIDQMDMPDLGDEADAPIIVPKPGQILRRSARTKIRKQGQTGEGPHRFQTRSRRPSGPHTSPGSPHSDQDHSLQDFDPRQLVGGPRVPTIGTVRPESFSDVAFIYDAYAVDDPTDSAPVLVSQPPADERSPSPPSVSEFEPQQLPLIEPHHIPIPPTPPLHHPQPRHHLTPTTEPQPPSRTPSPDASSITLVEAPHRASETSYHHLSAHSPPLSHVKDKDKGKKTSFFGWGGEKGKKGPKEKESKDGSFLGSLFGGSKKKHEEYTGTGLGTGLGRETAAALLGPAKPKSPAPSATTQPGGPYARYPIHVERAIYRLSHIKLANPRRPLYEQVLISNLMFWYLGVINNKGQTNGTGQNQTKETQQQQETGQQPKGPTQDANANLEKERKEQEEREKEERERIELEKEREKEREREKEFLLQQSQPAQRREKRGPLTRPAPGPPGQRRAEMPVRGPQYEMQQRMMEQEYGGYDSRNQHQNRPGPILQYNNGPQLIQPQPQMVNNVMYFNSGNPPSPNGPSQRTSPPQLPPGAMPPIHEQAPWNNRVRFSFLSNYSLSYSS